MIAVDADEVTCDFIGAVSHVLGKHGLPPVEPLGYWDIYSRFSPEQQEVFDSLPLLPEFPWLIKAFPHARKMLDELRTLDEVVCITAPFKGSEGWHHARILLLSELGFDPAHIVFADSRLKSRFQCEILVEDRVDTLLDWAEAHPCDTGIALRTNHNYNELHKVRDVGNIYIAETPDDVYRLARKDYGK